MKRLKYVNEHDKKDRPTREGRDIDGPFYFDLSREFRTLFVYEETYREKIGDPVLINEGDVW